MPKLPFFFDIETTGFFKDKPSIVSISFGQDPKGIQTLRAKPEPGTFISRWAKERVWKPLVERHGVPTATEGGILKSFLGELEGLPKGTEVTGWNIGYTAGAGARGFDVPGIMQRASVHGLEREFAAAFQPLKLRDVGQEYAYKLSKEITEKWGHLAGTKLEAGFFGQLESYAKLGGVFEAQGATERLAARQVSEKGYWAAGWKQEITYKSLFDRDALWHLSEEDVRTGLELEKRLETGAPLFQTEEQVAQYGRATLRRSLVSQAMSPYLREGMEAAGKYPSLIETAKGMEKTGGWEYRRFSSHVIASINREAKVRGADVGRIQAGLGAGEAVSERVAGVSRIGRLIPEIGGVKGGLRMAAGFLGSRRVLAGVAVGTAALWIAQPGSWFSGKDDAYNTIEGLPHGGEAERMRRVLTEFGSGWDKLRALAKVLGKSYEEMIHLPTFQEALRSAKSGALLGKGKLGEVYQMTAEFKGRQFQFARKVGKIGKYEVEALRGIQESVGPTVYGQRKGALDIELFEGTTLKKLELGKLKEVSEAEISTALGKLHETGFTHGDPHLGNLMLVQTPKGPKVGIIDLGEATRGGVAGPSGDIAAVLLLRKARLEHRTSLEALDLFAARHRVPSVAHRSVSPINVNNQFDGFQHGGLSSSTRPSSGFGSGKILSTIINFARRVFGVRKAVTAKPFGSLRPRLPDFEISAHELRFGKVSEHAVGVERLPYVGSSQQIQARIQTLSPIERQREFYKRVREAKQQGEGQVLLTSKDLVEGVAPSKESIIAKGHAYDALQRQQKLSKMIPGPSKYNVPGVPKPVTNVGRPATNVEPNVIKGISDGSGTDFTSPWNATTGLHRAAKMYSPTKLIGKKKRWYTKHREAVIRGANGSHRAGRRHTDPAGRLVL